MPRLTMKMSPQVVPPRRLNRRWIKLPPRPMRMPFGVVTRRPPLRSTNRTSRE